jgi:hypothetical protein
MDEHNPDECLHCFLQRAVEDWCRKTGRMTDGMPDAAEEVMSAGIAALVADLMAQSPDNHAAGTFFKMVMLSTSSQYPYFRAHYRKVAQESILEDAQPRGKPN